MPQFMHHDGDVIEECRRDAQDVEIGDAELHQGRKRGQQTKRADNKADEDQAHVMPPSAAS
ncbi:MAG: hypothetical protein PSY14_11435 [bacterium]|nr:hypothetical protein [bacterium]